MSEYWVSNEEIMIDDHDMIYHHFLNLRYSLWFLHLCKILHLNEWQKVLNQCFPSWLPVCSFIPPASACWKDPLSICICNWQPSYVCQRTDYRGWGIKQNIVAIIFDVIISGILNNNTEMTRRMSLIPHILLVTMAHRKFLLFCRQ